MARGFRRWIGRPTRRQGLELVTRDGGVYAPPACVASGQIIVAAVISSASEKKPGRHTVHEPFSDQRTMYFRLLFQGTVHVVHS
ncbi:MAG: hypothetical protein AMXMBFR55_33180 [Gemmatimonadota bacterium]